MSMNGKPFAVRLLDIISRERKYCRWWPLNGDGPTICTASSPPGGG